jgi:hypothetical protein
MKLYVWRWSKDPSKVLITLPTNQLFEDSETFSREWILEKIFDVVDPLLRPIPKDMNMTVVQQSKSFPYHSYNLVLMNDLFNPTLQGVYFLSNQKQRDEILKFIDGSFVSNGL